MNYYFESSEETLKSLHDKTFKDCKILYKNYKGYEYVWECDYGWNRVLSDLSYKIENLNILYKKYGVECTASQVKEKFNELRFYYNIDCVKRKYNWLRKLTGVLVDMLRMFDYKLKLEEVKKYPETVRIVYKGYIDAEHGLTDFTIERLEEIYKDSKFEIADGKIYRTYTRYIVDFRYYKASRWRPLYWLLGKILDLNTKLSTAPMSAEQELLVKSMGLTVDGLIEQAELECSRTCMVCGATIESGQVFCDKHKPDHNGNKD